MSFNRWTIIRAVDVVRYDIPWFFRNIFRFRKTLWSSRPWDWSGLYQAMHDSMAGMEEQQRVYGNSVNSEKYAKQIRVCLALLERLSEDDYLSKDFDFTERLDKPIRVWLETEPKPLWKEQIPYRAGFEIRASNQKADRALLFKMMDKHSQSWWD